MKRNQTVRAGTMKQPHCCFRTYNGYNYSPTIKTSQYELQVQKLYKRLGFQNNNYLIMQKKFPSISCLMEIPDFESNLHISIIDEEGIILFVNTTLLNTLMQKPENILHKNITEFIKPWQQDELKYFWKNAFERQTSIAVEIRISENFYCWMHWKIIRLGDQPGLPASYLCYGYNVVEKTY